MKEQNELIVWFTVLGVIFLFLIVYLYYGKKRYNPFEKPMPTGRLFVIFAIFAVVMRLAMAYNLPGYGTDMDCFRAWANNVYTGGIENFYTGDFFADYPPIYIYILYFFGFIRNVFDLGLASPMYGMLLHLPAIICDVAGAYIVYRLAKQKFRAPVALMLSTLLLLNPAVMFNSSVWGQMDIILTLMLVLTIYLLVKDKLIWASVAFIVAFLIKPQAIMILPILGFVFIRNIIVSKDKKKAWFTFLISLGIMIGLFFLIPLPFGANQEPLWLAKQYLSTIGQYDQVTLNALNIFAMLGENFTPASMVVFLGLPGNVWGFIMIALVCVYTLFLYIKNSKKEFLFALTAFLLMGVFALGHGMHERYLFPVPVLLLLAFIFMKDKRLIWCTVLTFISLLLNQSLSLYYYQVMMPMAWTVAVSAVNMAIFIYTGYVITRLAFGPVREKAGDTDILASSAPMGAFDWEEDGVPLVGTEAAVQEETLVEEAGNGETEAPETSRVEFQKKLYPDAEFEVFDKPPAQMRLDSFERKKTLTKKDGLLMIVISAIYAVVAFTNLGAFKVPETPVHLDNTQIIVEFAQEEQIATIEYYAGYGKADFMVLSSKDGNSYTPVDLTKGSAESVTEVKHELKDLYKWQIYTTDINAKYIAVRPYGGDLDMLEMAFKDKDGNLVTPQSVTPPEAAPLFDEQELVPDEPTYMTDFYFDEIYHVRTAYENIHQIEPYEITHPPLGKIILACGIEMFGMNPFGWRFMGTLTGVLMLPVMYIFAKMLLKKTKYAAFATILFAADFMHFAQTRIGTIDSYSILWIMLMYLFMYLFTQSNFNKEKLSKSLVPLALSGLFFGIGAATKWLCMYAGAGLAVIFFMTLYKRYKEYQFAKESKLPDYKPIVQSFKWNVLIMLAWCVLFFIVVPLIIYFASYYPYTIVTQGNAYDFSRILENQSYMLNYHSLLDPDKVHPFASMWYSWPMDVRPVLFFNGHNTANGTISTLSTMGNPLIWWTGVVACIWLIIDSARGKHRNYGVTFTAIAALSQFVPWWFIAREVFIYHYFATVPFLIILIVFWLRNVERDFKYGKEFGWIFVTACIAMFIIFYPVITGIPFNAEYVTSLRWLQSWPFYG
ncbi:hypothetical protein AR437_04510 [Christensenella hongkongensis]|uniref:glycosyltransferase family 39 protein n=2 Tax=Christensenella hongkongensis TaxID=270498 RepID=UPI00073FD233|nr:glycosyltransferase family 39 protein [Christensenella hongkongensis]KUJ31286.1 hypothetical protein AR437_04510 [Christensenella hongkongensis]